MQQYLVSVNLFFHRLNWAQSTACCSPYCYSLIWTSYQLSVNIINFTSIFSLHYIPTLVQNIYIFKLQQGKKCSKHIPTKYYAGMKKFTLPKSVGNVVTTHHRICEFSKRSSPLEPSQLWKHLRTICLFRSLKMKPHHSVLILRALIFQSQHVRYPEEVFIHVMAQKMNTGTHKMNSKTKWWSSKTSLCFGSATDKQSSKGQADGNQGRQGQHWKCRERAVKLWGWSSPIWQGRGASGRV